jgi:DNA ligase-1
MKIYRILDKEWSLYRLNRAGNIQQYIVRTYTYSDGAFLEFTYGIIGGKIQEDLKPIYPVNVGKANETTPIQQARLEAQSKINKLIDKGYQLLDPVEVSSNLGELQSYLKSLHGTDANRRYLPMLATKNIDKAEYPGYVQKKFDGNRCIIKNEGGTIIARSRRGKIFDLEFITDLFEGILPEGWEIDGEIYAHGISLQNIVSMVKNSANPHREMLKYRAYDIFGKTLNDIPYKKRRWLLKRITKKTNSDKILHTDTYRVEDHQELTKYFMQFLDEGYEGAMYRNPDFPYEVGTRSKGLIKVKDTLEEEFEIVDMEEATGRDEGTAIFVLKTGEGKVFNSRPMGTREERKEYLENKEEHIGEMATVRFQYWTDGGVPGHSRVVNIRNFDIQG